MRLRPGEGRARRVAASAALSALCALASIAAGAAEASATSRIRSGAPMASAEQRCAALKLGIVDDIVADTGSVPATAVSAAWKPEIAGTLGSFSLVLYAARFGDVTSEIGCFVGPPSWRHGFALVIDHTDGSAPPRPGGLVVDDSSFDHASKDSVAIGRAAQHVGSGSLVLRNGRHVPTLLEHGYFMAWWPGDVAVGAATARR